MRKSEYIKLEEACWVHVPFSTRIKLNIFKFSYDLPIFFHIVLLLCIHSSEYFRDFLSTLCHVFPHLYSTDPLWVVVYTFLFGMVRFTHLLRFSYVTPVTRDSQLHSGLTGAKEPGSHICDLRHIPPLLQ
jgi:hypothetical protein